MATKQTDSERLDAICRRLPRDDADWLRERLLPSFMLRQLRLAERDALLRGAAAMLEGADTARAKWIAEVMGRPEAARGTPAGFTSLVARAVALNGGSALGWRQIYTAMSVTRLTDGLRKSQVETANQGEVSRS